MDGRSPTDGPQPNKKKRKNVCPPVRKFSVRPKCFRRSIRKFPSFRKISCRPKIFRPSVRKFAVRKFSIRPSENFPSVRPSENFPSGRLKKNQEIYLQVVGSIFNRILHNIFFLTAIYGDFLAVQTDPFFDISLQPKRKDGSHYLYLRLPVSPRSKLNVT